MKKILIVLLLVFANFCSSDNKLNDKPKSEEQMLEAERDSARKQIDSLENELKRLEIKRDSIKSIPVDTLREN